MTAFVSRFAPAHAGRSMALALSLAAAAALVAGCGSTKEDDRSKAPEKLYSDAKDDLDAGSWDRAAKSFERVEGRAAGTLLAQQAMLERAYALYRSGERTESLAVLDRFLKLHPSSPAYDYALYMRGVVNFNDDLGLFGSIARQDLSERDQKASREAYLSFRQLVDQFPDSRYAPDARQRLNYIVNALANNEVHVARYYYRRGAYVAAANRAQQAVQEFQQSPATEEALYILMMSYDRLGLPQLRDDAERVLKQNYPQSRLIGEGIRDKEKAWWQFW